jgi:hypothetical protein
MCRQAGRPRARKTKENIRHRAEYDAEYDAVAGREGEHDTLPGVQRSELSSARPPSAVEELGSRGRRIRRSCRRRRTLRHQAREQPHASDLQRPVIAGGFEMLQRASGTWWPLSTAVMDPRHQSANGIFAREVILPLARSTTCLPIPGDQL